MDALILLLICLSLGMLFRRIKLLPESTPSVLNVIVLALCLPALTLHHLHSLTFVKEHIAGGVMPWIFFLLSLLFFIICGRILKWPTSIVGCLILMGGLGNTSFVGFPLVEAFYGQEAMGTAIVVDQVGSFMAVTFGGIWVASTWSAREQGKRKIKWLFIIPPAGSFILALFLRNYTYPSWFETILIRIGDMLAPLALLSVGFQLRFGSIKKYKFQIIIGLLFKLILAPAIIALLYIFGLGLKGQVLQIILFESAMAPMISAAILATESKLEAELAALMVGLGIPLSLLTLWGWYTVLLKV